MSSSCCINQEMKKQKKKLKMKLINISRDTDFMFLPLVVKLSSDALRPHW